jgi:hypothetical protein
VNDEVTEEQSWLATAADCERIAAIREAQHDPVAAERWREFAAEARENARRAKEYER